MTIPSIIIARVTVEDWKRARAIRLAALAEDPDAFGSTLAGEQDQDDAFWIGRASNPKVANLMATLNGRDAGVTVVAPNWDHPGIAGMYSVWVAPWARGHGVGDALMTEAFRAAADLGYTRIALDVGDFNTAAIGLYERNGFIKTGRTSTMPAPREHIAEIELARDL